MRTDMTHTGPFYAVKLVFRDESKPDVFGWEAINDVFSRRWRQAVSQQDERRQIYLGSIMNVQNEWEGSVPEPDASISDGKDREARLLKSVVNGVFAEHRKAQRVEDTLDGRDRLERIEQRLDGLLTALLNRQASTIESPYLTTQEAAAYLKSTVKTVYDWVKRGKLHPVPGLRGLFTKEALDRFAQTRRRRK